MSAVALQSFGFGNQLVRVSDRDGVAWFVGNDVCEALEIVNRSQALARLEGDERDEVCIVDPIGRQQLTTIISESGMYALIFTSRKPAAKLFRRWVTGEVLPAIRTTGRYEVANDEVGAPAFAEPVTPDEFEVLRARLSIVKEARIAFGVRAARKAWRLAGLPDLTPEPQDIEYHPVGVIATLHQSIADWMDARTEAAPGHREGSTALFRDYLDWAKANAVPRAEIVSHKVFSVTLSHCGVVSLKSNGVFKIGLRLVAK